MKVVDIKIEWIKLQIANYWINKKAKIFLICFFVFLSFSFNDKRAYNVFNNKGHKVSQFDSLLKDVLKADVILFGEIHNNPISHWLELQLAKSISKIKKDDFILGMEMMQADHQLIINEYLKGITDIENITKVNNWNNFKTDYKPLLSLAKNKNISFIATNIPKRYASVVAHKGFQGLDSLSKKAYDWMAPLPVSFNQDQSVYKKMKDMMGKHSAHGGLDVENLVKAQAIKDATMAHFIYKHIKNKENTSFMHINGNFHSKNFEGIYWYLKNYDKSLKIKTIACVEQASIDSLKAKNKEIADYIITIPEDMTKTH